MLNALFSKVPVLLEFASIKYCSVKFDYAKLMNINFRIKEMKITVIDFPGSQTCQPTRSAKISKYNQGKIMNITIVQAFPLLGKHDEISVDEAGKQDIISAK